MKISIIVPVYNKEKYISQCIDSLVEQTWVTKQLGELEIVLVDDESTDSSGSICDEYMDKYPLFIKSIRQKNTGAAGAWRRGLKETTGQYIMFVDSDDWIDLDCVERLAAELSDRDDEMILSDYVIERSNGTKTYIYQTLAPGEYDRQKILDEIIPQLWGYEDRRVTTSRCMKLISKKLIEDNEHYSRTGLRFGEDNALTLPCVMDAGRIVVLDHAAMYHYRYVTNSVVHGYDTTLVESIELLQKITVEMIRDKFADTAYAGNFERLCIREFPYLLMYAVKNEVRGNRSGYIGNICSLCGPDKYAKLIKETPVMVEHTANKLIYHVMKHPTPLNCKMLRGALDIWSICH